MAALRPNVESHDLYEILGVSHNATSAEIDSAAKLLYRKYHPDRNPDDKAAAEEIFKKVAEAHNVLKDEAQKKKYDTEGKLGGDVQAACGGCSPEPRKRPCPNATPERPSKRTVPACSTPVHMPSGAAVTVRGLRGAAQHNGKRATVREFDPAKRRYVVALQDGEVLSLKVDNLTQLCSVVISGLNAKPGLNGCKAVVERYDPEAGRYVVKTTDGDMKLKRECCLLEIGTCVILCEFAGEQGTDLNGIMARVEGVDKDGKHYALSCEDGQPRTVRFENVLC